MVTCLLSVTDTPVAVSCGLVSTVFGAGSRGSGMGEKPGSLGAMIEQAWMVVVPNVPRMVPDWHEDESREALSWSTGWAGKYTLGEPTWEKAEVVVARSRIPPVVRAGVHDARGQHRGSLPSPPGRPER